MIRKAFTMRLKPGAMAEYKKHHDEIWPELVREIERCGIRHFTTFEADPVLFLFSEIEDEGAWARLWDTEIHRKWGEIMSRLMEFKDGKVDSSPVREIFRFEARGGQPRLKAKARRTAKPAKAKRAVKKPAARKRGAGRRK